MSPEPEFEIDETGPDAGSTEARLVVVEKRRFFRLNRLAPPMAILAAGALLLALRGIIRPHIVAYAQAYAAADDSAVSAAGKPGGVAPRVVWRDASAAGSGKEIKVEASPTSAAGAQRIVIGPNGPELTSADPIGAPIATAEAPASSTAVAAAPAADPRPASEATPRTIEVAARATEGKIVLGSTGPILTTASAGEPQAHLEAPVAPAEPQPKNIATEVSNNKKETVAAPAEPEPEPVPLETGDVSTADTNRILEDIIKASQAKQAELEHNNRLKGPPSRKELAQQTSERMERLRKAVVELEKERVKFHGELESLMSHKHTRLAARIRGLMEAYGKNAPPEVIDAARRMSKRADRAGAAELTKLLRDIGFPEVRILDMLYKQEVRRIPERNGPRDEDDALVRASRMLLAVPLRNDRSHLASPAASAARSPAKPPRDGQTTPKNNGRN